jgi:hypothetical protein
MLKKWSTYRREYEADLIKGFLKFLVSPVQTSRKLARSYFVGRSLSGILLVLLSLLLAEPFVLHFLIAKNLSSAWSIPLHSVLALLELWIIYRTLGHLYWIANSRVEVNGRFINIDFGRIWWFVFRPAFIDRLEFSNFTPTKPRILRFTLGREINLRIYFRYKLPAMRMGRTVHIDSLEISLRESELDFFKNAYELLPFGGVGWPFQFPSATIEKWARGLQIFRFVGMVGGHANDDNEVVAALKKPNEGEFSQLQYGWTKLFGEDVFVHVYDDQITITAGTTKANPWFAGEETFEKVRILDRKLQNLNLDFIEPPSRSTRCVSPKIFPEIWSEPEGTFARKFEKISADGW